MFKILSAAVIAATLSLTAFASAEPTTTDQVARETKTDRAATFDERFQVAQATTQTTTQTRTPTEPAQVTTTVKGGSLLADIVQWFWLAFGTVVTGAIMGLIYKVFAYFGIQVEGAQRAQLQAVVVNGLNSAAAKAQASLRDNEKLDIDLKGQIVADAIEYTQAHAAETIKALGLDPNSGDAVEAIRARIETALNDPKTPTPPAITPPEGKPNPQPLAPNA